MPGCVSLIGNPELLTNDHINELGRTYLKAHPECISSTLFGIHTNQPLALQLSNFNPATNVTAYEKWLYLVNKYTDIPKNEGVLADQIRKLFSDAFNVKIEIDYQTGGTSIFDGPATRYALPTKIVAELLRGIVNEFYAKMYKKNNEDLLKSLSDSRIPSLEDGYHSPVEIFDFDENAESDDPYSLRKSR